MARGPLLPFGIWQKGTKKGDDLLGRRQFFEGFG
jgi:hypothetical protein